VASAQQTPESTSAGNHCRLGLAEVPPLFRYTAKGTYDSRESGPTVKDLVASIEQNDKIRLTIERKGLRGTQLGRQFVRTCVVRKA
jgi:hypothetical protein